MIKKLINAFWHDTLAPRRWIRGVLAAAIPLFLQLLVGDDWMQWSVKQWILHALPVVLGFIVGSIQSSASVPPKP